MPFSHSQLTPATHRKKKNKMSLTIHLPILLLFLSSTIGQSSRDDARTDFALTPHHADECHHANALDRAIACLYASDDDDFDAASPKHFLEQSAGLYLRYLIDMMRLRRPTSSVIPRGRTMDENRFYSRVANLQVEMSAIARRERDNATFWHEFCRPQTREHVSRCFESEYRRCGEKLEDQTRGLLGVWGTAGKVIDMRSTIDLYKDYYCFVCGDAEEFVRASFGLQSVEDNDEPRRSERESAMRLLGRDINDRRNAARRWRGKKGVQSEYDEHEILCLGNWVMEAKL